MTRQKKPYVKPEFTIIPAGSPKYNDILAALKAEGQQPQLRSGEITKDSTSSKVPSA